MIGYFTNPRVLNVSDKYVVLGLLEIRIVSEASKAISLGSEYTPSADCFEPEARSPDPRKKINESEVVPASSHRSDMLRDARRVPVSKLARAAIESVEARMRILA
jgi:hypothetical protein